MMKGVFEMKLNWKWATGIMLVLAVLFALQFAWQLWMLYGGYGSRMPMMRYGYSMAPLHGIWPLGMIFMWLVPFGELILLGLGIVWLVKQLTSKSS